HVVPGDVHGAVGADGDARVDREGRDAADPNRRRPRRSVVVAVADEQAPVLEAELTGPDDVGATTVRARGVEIDGQGGLVVILPDCGRSDGGRRAAPRPSGPGAGGDVDLAAALGRARKGRGQEGVVLASVAVYS